MQKKSVIIFSCEFFHKVNLTLQIDPHLYSANPIWQPRAKVASDSGYVKQIVSGSHWPLSACLTLFCVSRHLQMQCAYSI